MSAPLAPEVAPGVFHLSLLGASSINAYVLGDVLIDAGIRSSAPRLERLLGGHRLRAHALTHVHADHQGASHAICTARGLPLWVHGAEAALMEQGPAGAWHNTRHNPVTALQRQFWAGPAHPVSRTLRAGDEVAGFEVLETPGHAQGHISLWRERDRVLVAGDVLTGMDVLTGRLGLREPLNLFTLDQERNREQIRRLAALEPRLVLFGHGPPLRDPEALLRFASGLV